MDSMQQARFAVQSFVDCMPYLRALHGQVVVIKYGGHAMTDETLKRSFASGLTLLKLFGVHPVVVHGGGPQIGDMLKKLDIKSEFKAGLRVTDAATMAVVEMVLTGSVNKEVVNLVTVAGGKAVGLSGKDGLLLEARKKELVVSKPGEPLETVDIGLVGEVVRVNTDLILSLSHAGFIPIIAPVGGDAQGTTYNINADDAAGAVAGALKAKRFILFTDVAGVLDKDKKLIHSIRQDEAQGLIDDGTISGGMIPKISCGLDAVNKGVDKAVIADGRVENCLLLELFTSQGVGTELVSVRSA